MKRFIKGIGIKIIRSIPTFILEKAYRLSNKVLIVLNDYSLQSKVNEITLKALYPLNEDELGIICPFGIGDTLMTAGLVYKIKERYSVKKVVLIVKPAHKFIASCFPSVDKTFIRSDNIINVSDKSNILIRDQEITPKNYFYAHFENYNLCYLIGYKNFDLFDCYKALFKIDFQAKLEQIIEISDEAKLYCLNLFEHENLIYGKTVLLATEANSVALFPVEFWLSICQYLKSKKYHIILNSKFGLDVLAEYATYLNIPLEYLPCFSTMAGKVISLRSGLCDLLSLYSCDLTVLYPDIPWWSGSLFEGSSIKNMGFSSNVKEVVIKISDKELSKDFDWLKDNF